jgi:hypothetical protein
MNQRFNAHRGKAFTELIPILNSDTVKMPNGIIMRSD